VNVPEEEPRFGTLVTTPLGTDAVEALFDLSLYAFEEGRTIALDAVYNADFFDAWRMEELLDQLTLVLREAADSPGRALADFSLVTHRARTELPDTRAPLSETWHGPVQDRFAARAANHPSALAVADSHGAWSYGELDARSNRLARWLLDRGVRRGDAVAVWAHRSASTAWAMLGVLKAGAATVLLDPSHPVQRLAACLEEARPKALLEIEEAGAVPDGLSAFVESELGAARAVLPPLGAHAQDPFAGVPADPVGVQVGPDDIACITFTSGSTGAPKGVRGRHGSLSHFQPFLERRFGIGGDDRFSMLSGLAHDPLQRDVFTPLMAGGAVCVPAPADLDPSRLARWAARERVTVMHLTPAMAKILAGDIDPKERRLDDLRLVFLVGEQLMRRDVERLRRLAPEATLVNLYGTTETQRAVGHLVLPPGGELRAEDGSPLSCEVIPVGVGMEDVQLLIRDEAGRKAGLCEIGEVWVRSPHLALGYLDDDLTHERFVGAGDRRAYRTGDWGRYLRGGVVTIAGRRDEQVNVRGFRVELGEVESALASQAGIRDAVAVLDGEDRLVGYVTPSTGARLDPVALREATRGRLPDYMVPAAVVVLDELPLTPNRKVDRRALPAPRWSGASAYVAPRSPDEEIACALFAEVLGVDRVGTADSFFDLGGHSLLATRLVSRARSTLATEVSLRALFEAPTPAGLARAVAAARRKNASPPPHLARAPEEQRHRLSYAQTRLWFLDRLEPDSAAYNVATALRLSGDLDTMALGRAVAEIERRHEALRTRLVSLPEGPEQSFDSPRSSVLTTEDLRTSADSRREALRRIGEEASKPFDLTKGPLWRVRLLRAGGNEHFLSLVLHHAVTDGWSMDLILRELVALYGVFSEGKNSPLPDLPIQYADWAAWQRAWLEGGELDRQLAYWRRELDGVEPLEIPTDRPRTSRRGLRGASLGFELATDDAAALIRFARAEGATLFHVLLACFQALLASYAASEDVVVGTPVANRTLAQAEPLVGFFANTLPVRTRVESGLTLRALVRRVGEKVLDAYAHQDAPFESIVDTLNLRRDLSRNPLFDVMFLLQHADAPMPAPGDLVVEPLPADTGATPFDLTLAMADSRERIFGSLLYDADLFEATTIERLLAHFAGLVRTLTRNPDARLGELDLRSEAERAVTDAANSTAVLRPPRLVQALVEERAARAGSADAIVDEEGTLSYAELDALANRIARRLRRYGIGPEAGVGLLAGRTARSIAGILGIFKSGGVLVPLDASLPTRRLDTMLSLAGVRAVVSERGLDSALASRDFPVVRLDAEDLASESADPLEPMARPSNAAYVIFTSGSTGEPKGAVVEHGAIAERSVARAEQSGLGPGDRMLHFHSPVFDGALEEILTTLCSGATVVVHPDPRGETPEGFLQRAAGARLTVAHLPVGFLHLLADDLAKSGAPLPGSLRHIITGGESPSGSRLAALLRGAARGRLTVCNAYGPTEAVIEATAYYATSEEETRDPVPIGLPIANSTVYLLDRRMRPVPLGATGEIYIGGKVLARGYAGRSAETAASFLPDPFSAEPGARLYRTGDLARQRSDGELVFLGRRDGQVKLRGFRVELGEIETALSRLDSVREAAVLVRERGAGAYLVAYVVPAGGTELDAGKLRAALAAALPDYMVPRIFIPLVGMPRTATGKVDRRALPAPERETRKGKRLAPRDDLERALAGFWAEALGGGGDDIEEDFFEAGGNSLLAMRIVGSIRRELNADLPVSAVFREPTIAGLARLLRRDALETSPLVTLRAGAGLPPLVCVHEVGGGISAFAALADHLDPRRPVLGIHGFDDAPAGRIEDAAARYAGAIARAVPEGPIDLLGWSYGGLVAYETALSLSQAGREVRTLVLLDAAAPGDEAQEKRNRPALASTAAAMWGIEVEKEDAGEVLAAARDAGALPADVDGEQAAAWLAGVAARMDAAESYRPRPYDGKVVLVRGTESIVGRTRDDLLGWQRLVTGSLALEWAPGSHYSVVSGDGARVVAAIVERHAARTQAADT